MKLINAIRMIEERDRLKRRAEREMQKQKMPFKSQFNNMHNSNHTLAQVLACHNNLVHVQSVFPKDDVLALKMKAKETHIKEALLKAVYFYLENAEEE